MKFLLINNRTGEQKRINYPRVDTKPVVLDKDFDLYIIQEKVPEIIDGQYLSPLPLKLTEEKDSEYPVNIAVQDYEVMTIPKVTDTIDDLKEAIVIVAKEKKDRTAEEEAHLIELTTKIKNNENTIISSVNTDVRIK